MNSFTHGYALVIGVHENKVTSLSLPGVARDIAALQQVLRHPERCGYPVENVRILQGDQASGRGIRDGLAWLRNKVTEDEQATALIYYSGHGWKDQYSGEYFLIPYDVDANSLRYSALRAADFAVEIRKIQPPRLLVLLDCCHADGMAVKEVGSKAIQDIDDFSPASLPAAILMRPEKGFQSRGEDPTSGGQALHALAQGHGRAVLSSSQGDQKSLMRPDGQMSLFTYHLIEALTGHAAPPSGANEVLVSDLASYVQRHVPASARRMGVQQEPEAFISGVFPVALLLGGKGLAAGARPPDPLTALPGQTTIITGGDFVPGAKIHIDRSIKVDGPVTGSTLITGDIRTGE